MTRPKCKGSFEIAQLRHAYTQLAAGKVVAQREFADGLIAPVIRYLERMNEDADLTDLLRGATIMLRSEDENHEVAILVSNRKDAKDLMVALLTMSIPEDAREKLGKAVRIRRG